VLPPGITDQFHDYGWLLNWLPRLAGYFGKKCGEQSAARSQDLENRILDYLNTKVQPSSAGIVWADVVIKPIIADVPFGVAFPPALKGFAKLKNNLRNLPYETRHRWRMFRQYVPEEQFNQVLLKLLRQQRIGHNPLDGTYRRGGWGAGPPFP